MVTRGNLFLKMMACGDRLRVAQRLEEKAEARFEAHRTEEGSEERRRASQLVDNLAGKYLAVRAWRQSVQQEIAGGVASQHISPVLRAIPFGRVAGP